MLAGPLPDAYQAARAAAIGNYSQSEATLTEPLLDRLEPGIVLLAHRGFFSYALWRTAIATGADLVWRVRTDQAGPQPTHLEDLRDGSWLAHLRRSTPASARREEPMLVRVVHYTIADGRETPTTYRCSPPCSTPTRSPRPGLGTSSAVRCVVRVGGSRSPSWGTSGTTLCGTR